MAAAASPAFAQEADAPVVVEMFLSQACSASPPAAELLSELEKRPELVVLSWHVGYWDLLANRKSGRWRDPFATPEASVRQKIYNRKVRDRGTVFTPQAIVNGAGSAVGSKEKELAELIRLAPRVQRRADIEFAREIGGGFTVSVRASGEPGEVFLVRFIERAETAVMGGDNAGTVFAEPNVVTEFVRLGTFGPHRASYQIASPEPGMGCAILLQERGQGAIVAARYCP